jgi:hypothetical protein
MSGAGEIGRFWYDKIRMGGSDIAQIIAQV